MKHSDCTQKEKGYALITVLLMVSLMAIMIIGVFVLVKDDRVRAKGYMEVGRSRFLTDMATQEVLAKIMDGSKVRWEDGKAIGSYTAAPGVIEMRKYKEPINKGYHQTGQLWVDPDAWGLNPFAHEYEYTGEGDWQPANPLTIPLYSRRWFAPAVRYKTASKGNVSDGNSDYNPARVFNLNTPNNPFAPGSLYISGSPDEAVLVKDFEASDENDWNSGRMDDLLKRDEIDSYRYQPGEAASDRPLNIQWIPIYKFAGKGNLYIDERGRTRRNPVVGRYAYWVDVENTKVNINVADRKFVDSEIATITGETEALNPDSGGNSFYFVQNPNALASSASDAVKIRGQLEATMMDAFNGGRADPYIFPPVQKNLIKIGSQGRGDNAAAVQYHRMWLDWQSDGLPPNIADNSLVDWRVFTGLRPLAGGLGEDTTIEGLLADAASDTENRFNTFGEVFSLLDPKTEEQAAERGLASLTAMRRTYGNAATIYGWDEERDPLGRPKIDIVKLQTGGVGGPLYNDLLSRLSDPDYYLAYYTGADPTGGKSFAKGFNALVGDNNPNNDANGIAVVEQMLANIIEYGKPHNDPPYINEGKGIIGAKSAPYVTEVATRARNGMWRLHRPTKNADRDDEDAIFDAMAENFHTKVDQLVQVVEAGVTTTVHVADINDKLRAVLEFEDPSGTVAARSNGNSIETLLRAVTIDLNFALANPNPFATAGRGSSDPRANEVSGQLKLDYEWSGITPIEQGGAKTANFDGLYVARPIPLRTGGYVKPRSGVRVDGESVYFDLGMISGEDMGDPANTTALRINGWDLSGGGGVYHRVPIRHLGQSSAPRPWWAMAQPNANPGQIANSSHNSHKGTDRGNTDIYSFAHFYSPYNLESGTSGQSFQWEIPNVPINVVTQKVNPTTSDFPYQDWRNVSVGWFSARTIAEFCRALGPNVVQQGLPGCLYVSEDSWEAVTTEWDLVRVKTPPEVNTYIADGSPFRKAIDSIAVIADSIHRNIPALVETVIAIDPTVGHRTGNPDAYSHANLGEDPSGGNLPTGLPSSNVGHFYGTNGHPWRLASPPPGPSLDSAAPDEQDPTGPGTRVPITEPEYGEETITYKTPVGNTFVTTTKTIRVKVGERIVGYRTVYPNRGGGKRGRGPVRKNYTLTESFHNPQVTSVAQGDLLGDGLSHAAFDLGWETENIQGISKSAPRIKGPTGANNPNSYVGWDTFFSSAPKGDLMVSIGEIGLCHSGLLGRPIELTQKHTNYPNKDVTPPGWWHSDVPYVGSPYHGLPPSMLLDLLTPGAFRDNSTGERYTESQWRAGTGSNTPASPRRGTWNINAVPASDTYMAMREGEGGRNLQNEGHQSRSIARLKTHPVWAPNGHGMRKSWGDDRGWMDPMMNPFPRYRRGFESWLAMIVGDYTPYRSRGEAIWGRVEVGGAYAALSAPWFSWRGGNGGPENAEDPTIPFDPDQNGARSSLFAMGRVSIDARNPNNSRKFTKHGITGLFYSDQGYDTSRRYRNPTIPLSKTARVGNFPLRHHNSELISVSAQDITELHTALNPKNSSVGWSTKVGYGGQSTYGFLSKYGSWFQPYQNFASSKTHNGHPGSFIGTGIYANAPVVLAANQISTSANVFTAHIVTQAVRDNGKEREDFTIPAENTNTGLGFMDHDDEVLGEQWTQVVVARIPSDGRDPETGGPKYDYRILYSRTLDHQAQ